MPEISRFFGIVVTMYYTDHVLPHFHAKYGGQRISVAIEDARILSGDFPGRARELVFEGCGSSSLAAQSVSPAAARQEAIGSVKAW